MKQLIYPLVLPLTIISLAIFTKEWYVLPLDAAYSTLSGFPFPYVCNGWHTSLSLQYFLFEFVIDFLVYFIFWLSIIFSFNKFVLAIKMPKILSKFLLITSLFIIGITGIFVCNPNNLFYLKRDFNMEIIKTNYLFIWEDKIYYYSNQVEKK